MPRQLSPSEAAARLRKWAAAGFNPAVVGGLLSGLEVDRRESQGRAPHRTGALASTIRVKRPSSTRAAKIGRIDSGLSAGGKKAPYGRIIQEGGKTRPHTITPKKAPMLAFVVSGRLVFAKSVNHPGSTFPPRPFLRINKDRLAKAIDESIGRSVARTIDA